MSATPNADPLVELVVEDEAWLRLLPHLESLAEQGARLALAGAGLGAEGYEISVLACDDERIAQLNADFRGQRKPTNVLSWPAFDLAPDRPGGFPSAPPPGAPDARVGLGDVAIARQTVECEAKLRSIDLKAYVIHLILHGCLHLLGYDHETENDAVLMEGIERRQLLSAGIADPYE